MSDGFGHRCDTGHTCSRRNGTKCHLPILLDTPNAENKQAFAWTCKLKSPIAYDSLKDKDARCWNDRHTLHPCNKLLLCLNFRLLSQVQILASYPLVDIQHIFHCRFKMSRGIVALADIALIT